MAGVILEIDPTSEDSANVSLVLVDNTSYFLLSEEWPTPEPDVSYVSSITTEGELAVTARYRNTTGTFSLRVAGSTAADLQTKLNYIDKKLGKIVREGGTLKRTTPSGTTYVTDLLSGALAVQFSKRYITGNRADVTVTLARKPYWRGAQVTLGSHSELTLPCLIFTEASITGDVPALGRLIITEAQAANQLWLRWGIRSRYYDSAATAALFYEAEGRTPLGSAAIAIGTATPSGSGSNVVRSGALTTSMTAVVSTQTTGAGAQLSHVGDYQVYARCMSRSANTGTVSYALQWTVGEFLNPTTNATVTPTGFGNGTWVLVNLGQVSIPKVVQGTQVWEGRVMASSTVAGDTVDIDHIVLIPITEGAGVVSAPATLPAPSVIGGSDTFTGSGTLNLLNADIGGAWATSGATTDFTEGSGVVTRAVGTDASNAGRFAVLGTTTYTGQVVQTFVTIPAPASGLAKGGLLLRWTDASNHLRVVMTQPVLNSGSFPTLYVIKRVTGTDTILGSVVNPSGWAQGVAKQLKAFADGGGNVTVWIGPNAAAPVITVQDAVLATGGTLASGKAGFYDESSATNTRTYDSFFAYAYSGDAALFASKQLEVRNDRVIRQDSGGTLWRQVAKYEGDYLLVPCSGREGRTVQVIVKACRNDPTTGTDSAIDDISAQLVYTPRFLTLPE